MSCTFDILFNEIILHEAITNTWDFLAPTSTIYESKHYDAGIGVVELTRFHQKWESALLIKIAVIEMRVMLKI